MLACVAGSPKALAELEEKIRRLKLELAPKADPAGWELHAGDMFHNRGGSILGLLETKKQMAIMRRIVDIVRGCDVVLFYIVVMGTRMHGKRATHARVVEHATALLVERLEQFAQEQGEGVTLRVVSDNAREHQRLAMERALERRATRRSPPLGRRRVTLIEFADSLSNGLVQVADALAYIINRHAGGDAAFGEMFRDIRRKTWRRRGRSERVGVGTAGRVNPEPPPLGAAPYVGLPWRGA